MRRPHGNHQQRNPMRNRSFIVLVLSIGVFPAISLGATLEEDIVFWNRFLQNGQTDSMSMLTTVPTPSPDEPPTTQPTISPTRPLPVTTPRPTSSPTSGPTSGPTTTPVVAPTPGPTANPTVSPITEPTGGPTVAVTNTPTVAPSVEATRDPTTAPSVEATDTPTVAPSVEATRDPTTAPSVEATDTPTATPSVEATRAPTTSPTSPPTEVPVIGASPVPSQAPSTDRPSSGPTANPTQTPTDQPFAPTASPTDSPTLTPSTMPTSECVLIINNTCSVHSGIYAGQECSQLGMNFPTCTSPPTEVTFMFDGGACEGSAHDFDQGFSCTDGPAGPVEPGSIAYIIVTDAKGNSIYHRDWVFHGANYKVTAPQGLTFPEYQRILVFSSNETGNPDNLVQEVQYPSSCDDPLSLKNKLGASQLVGFQNNEQGNVTCFAPLTVTIDIGTAPDFPGDWINLTEFDVLSNYRGLEDYSDLIQGVLLLPGESVSYDLPTYFADLSLRRRYTSLAQVMGETQSGRDCEGTRFDSFLAGNPIDPPLPTIPPTSSPTRSLEPTADNLLSTCDVSAAITCDCLSDDGLIIGPCSRIVDPRSVTCSDDLPASLLGFKYVGFDGTAPSPNTVFVQVTSPAGVQFSTSVLIGNRFQVEGNFAGIVDISVFEGSATGTLIDQFSLMTECSPNNPVLTLATVFGSLELVAFENALGFFSSVVQIRMSYMFTNTGNFTMVAESAIIDSAFRPDPFEALEEEVQVVRNEMYNALKEVSAVDLGEKFRDGTTFQFAFDVIGRAERSSLACFAGSRFSF